MTADRRRSGLQGAGHKEVGSACRHKPSQSQTSNESSLEDELFRRKHKFLKKTQPGPFITWMAWPSSLSQVSGIRILPIIHSLFLGQHSEMEIYIFLCSVVPNEYSSFLILHPLCPLHLTEVLNSLCVIIQQNSSTTMAMGKNENQEDSNWTSAGATQWISQDSCESRDVLGSPDAVEDAPQRKCMKKKWERGTAPPRGMFLLLPGWLSLMKSMKPSSMMWAWGRIQS